MPSVNAAILRDVFFERATWRDALLRHIPREHYEQHGDLKNVDHGSVREYIRQAYSRTPPGSMPGPRAASPTPRAARSQSQYPPPPPSAERRRVYKHRYSREERNQMRRAEQLELEQAENSK